MSAVIAAPKLKNSGVRFPINRFIFLQFVMLLLYAHAIGYRLLMYYKPGSGQYLTLSIALILFTVMLFLFLRIVATARIPAGIPMLFLSLYMLVGSFSIMNTYLYFGTVDIGQFAVGFYKSVLPVSLAFLAYFSIRNTYQSYRLIELIARINVLLAVIGFVTYLFGDIWVQFYLQLPQIEKAPRHFGGVLRMTSLLWNPLVFGILMSLNSILAWNAIFNAKKGKLSWSLIFVLSVIGTVASFTRTAWLLLMVGVMASSLFALKRIVRRILLTIVILLGTAIILLSVPLPFGHYESMPEAIVGHIFATFEYENPRVENVKVGLQRIVVYPIGYGLGTAGYAALPTRGADSPVVFGNYIAADNNYLSMALQVGIQGLLIFMLAQVTGLMRVMKKLIKSKEDKVRIVLGTAVGWIAGMIVAAAFLNVWEYNLVPHIVYAVLGVALRLSSLPAMRDKHAQVGQY